VNDVRFVPPLAVGKVPVTPVVKGKPVALVNVALVGVPNTGVTNVGEVAKTAEPVPVSSVKAERRLAELGVARKVATPVPRPDTPVAIGRPVAFVKVALVGVPRIGVTKVGEVANTADPEPVSSVKAPARLEELNEPKEVALPTEVTAQFRNISSFVTTKGVSNNVTDQYQKLYIKYRPLAENDRIIIKYKDKDILGLPVTTPQIPSFYTCTWTSPTTLTTNANLAAAKTYFDAQQLQSPIGELECEITAGAGAGQMSQITNITESSGTYTITLSDTIVGAVNTRNCDIIINNYKLLGEITYADTENYKEFPIALTSKWCQVKVIMDGVEITIEELQIINEKHLA